MVLRSVDSLSQEGASLQEFRSLLNSKLMAALAAVSILFPGCKDEEKEVTEIQKAVKRLEDLCANEAPLGYCNGDRPRSNIKFAIEDGRIVYDPGKGNFVSRDTGAPIAPIETELEAMKRRMREAEEEKLDESIRSVPDPELPEEPDDNSLFKKPVEYRQTESFEAPVEEPRPLTDEERAIF